MVNVLSDVSFWWIVPIALFSIVMGLVLYLKEMRSSENNKIFLYFLFTLRSFSLFLMGLLLLNLVYKQVEYNVQKPIFISLLDNSSSMLNYKDSNIVQSSLIEINDRLKERFENDFEFQTYLIGEKVRQKDTLNFKDLTSDLSEGFDFLQDNFYNDNLGAILFVSDGNYNRGKNPLVSSERILHTPIFTIGVGDTLTKVDQKVKNVIVNKVAFYENEFPIKVFVESNHLKGTQSKVLIYKKGRKIDEKTLFYEEDLDLTEVDFLLNAEDVGIQQYKVVLSEVKNEYSIKNNSQDFNIEVLESRNKVLFLFDSPHPDISAIKNELNKDDKITVESNFVSEYNGDFKGVDLVIWHEPIFRTGNSIQKLIESSNVPVLYIFGTNSESTFINRLPIGLKVDLRLQNDNVQAIVNDNFQLFYLTDELKSLIPLLPPLQTKFGSVELSDINTAFLSQRVGDVIKKEPLLYFGRNSFSKFGVLYGEGIWRWKLEDYRLNETNILFNELIQKATQYLLVRNNKDPFKIIIPKQINRSEEVFLRAEFYDETFKLTTKPLIHFTYIDEKGMRFKNEFSILKDSYVLPLGNMPPGRYDWEAKTTYNNELKIKKGTFVVSDIYQEDLSTNSNHTLLKEVSSNSNGRFYTFANIDSLIVDIEKRSDITSVSYAEPEFNKFVDYIWILFLISFLFILEWFLRRRLGLY
jgi:hypothetical protein